MKVILEIITLNKLVQFLLYMTLEGIYKKKK